MLASESDVRAGTDLPLYPPARTYQDFFPSFLWNRHEYVRMYASGSAEGPSALKFTIASPPHASEWHHARPPRTDTYVTVCAGTVRTLRSRTLTLAWRTPRERETRHVCTYTYGAPHSHPPLPTLVVIIGPESRIPNAAWPLLIATSASSVKLKLQGSLSHLIANVGHGMT